VTELLPNATFRVKLETITKSSPTPPAACARTESAFWHGVLVEMTPYDLTKDRITCRFK
jgi:translation initiation factor IF-1